MQEVVACLHRTLGAHDDQWHGLIVQRQGAKRWQVWQTRTREPVEVLTRAGDVLIVPKGMPHPVDTPTGPGFSVHLLFAATDQPAPPRPGDHPPPAGTAWNPRPTAGLSVRRTTPARPVPVRMSPRSENTP